MDIPSKLQNHWLWQDKPFTKGQAWIDLLFMASDKSIYYRGKVYNLPKDQLITSETILSQSWGWSRTKVRSFLQSLAECSMLIVDADNGKSIITILQYPFTASTDTTVEQNKTPKKKQVETQDKSTDYECNSLTKAQQKIQVSRQKENKNHNESTSKKGPQFIQLSILDAIKENNS